MDITGGRATHRGWFDALQEAVGQGAVPGRGARAGDRPGRGHGQRDSLAEIRRSGPQGRRRRDVLRRAWAFDDESEHVGLLFASHATVTW